MTGKWPKHNATIQERLRLHMIEAPSGCWIWVGSVSSNYGRALYGRFQLFGSTRYAHRVSYETFVGPIPAGMQIDHLCRRSRCIRPAHLQAVTPSVNTRRGTSPGARALRRTHCLRGHDYAEHGVLRTGRRVCRECRREYMVQYHARRRAEREAAA